MALGSALTPPALRGTSLALLGTATSVARLLASVVFGALWVTIGMEQAIVCFARGPGRRAARERRDARPRPRGGGRCLRPPATRDRRGLWFGLLVAACVAVAAASVTLSALHGPGGAAQRRGRPGPAREGAAARRARLPQPRSRARRPLRADRLDPSPGCAARARCSAGPPASAPTTRRGRGLCLIARRHRSAPRSGSASSGRTCTPWRELTLPGVPSRARISPDGRLGAVTAFVTGHSYADPGTFSTRTTILDMARGRKLADLEDFAVTPGREAVQVDRLQLLGRDLRPGRQHASTPRSRAAATPIWCAATCASARS